MTIALGKKIEMKKILSISLLINIVIIITITLLVNKAQCTCVAIGKVKSGELTKITTSLTKPDFNSIKTSMIETHATIGTISLLSGLLFLISCVLIFLFLNQQKNIGEKKE